jgi:hypothetical protein
LYSPACARFSSDHYTLKAAVDALRALVIRLIARDYLRLPAMPRGIARRTSAELDGP